MSKNETFLILGGAGLVGRQIAHEITKYLSPKQIIIASLYEHEVQQALEELKAVFCDSPVEWVGVWGNIFVRTEYAQESRTALSTDGEKREQLYDDLFGSMDSSYEKSYLAELVETYKPDVVIDSINTATAISYQDVHSASKIANSEVNELLESIETSTIDHQQVADTKVAFDLLVLSQSIPQLVRHIQLLYRAMVEAKTRLYLKIGTTGTGGMGLNIPYTHSEDRPSMKLMTKTAVAFAHTGLLFLMARTPDGPIVKEIKPGAMIGYADVLQREVKEKGKLVHVYDSRVEELNGSLILREDESTYECLKPLELPIVDTGENGLFTKGEFEAITALRQMEFITPEEIARKAMLEIKGSNTGLDVIAEIDSGIMNPTYRAGYLRQQVLHDMNCLEKKTGTHSVALGMLGPPEISKLLWEVELLNIVYGKLEAVLVQKPEIIAETLYKKVQVDNRLRYLITSIGVPILAPDGKQLIRGPFIRIPEIAGENVALINDENLDKWAKTGWVDLRPENFVHWQERFERMNSERQHIRGRGSASVTRQSYLFEEIRIGEVVGWIFNNEISGYRIK